MRNNLLYIALVMALILTGCTTPISPRVGELDNASSKVTVDPAQKDIDTGWEALWADDFTGAKKAFEKALSLSEDNPSAIRGYALALFSTGEEIKAAEYITRALKAEPGNPVNIAARDMMVEEMPLDKTARSGEKEGNYGLIESSSASLWSKREGYISLLYTALDVDQSTSKAKDNYKNLHFEDDWTIAGPFSNVSSSGFSKDYINEASFKKGDTYNSFTGLHNRSITWYKPSKYGSSGFVELGSLLNAPSWSAAYAFKEIEVDEDGTYAFVFAQKGAIKVWIDNELAVSDSRYRRTFDSHWVIEDLKKGTHTVLVKVCGDYGPMGFALSIEKLGDDTANRIHALTDSPVYGKLRSFLSASGSVDPYLAELANKVEEEPDNPENMFWLACALYTKNVTDAALEMIEAEDSMLFTWLKYKNYKRAGKKVEAYRNLYDLFEENSKFTPALRYVLDDLADKRGYEKIKESLDEIYFDNPKWFWGNLAELRVAVARDDEERVEGLLKNMEKNHNTLPHTYLLLLSNTMFPDSREEYYRKMKSNGWALQSDLLRLSEALDSMDLQKATSVGSNLSRLYPQNHDIAFQYISAHLRTSDSFETSEGTLDKLIVNFPNSVDLVELKASHMESSIEYLKEYRRTAPGEYNLNYQQKDQFYAEIDKEISSREQKYKEAMTKLEKLAPWSYAVKEENRKLKGKKSFDDFVEPIDSISVIEMFEELGDFENTDYAIVLDDSYEMHFIDGSSRQISHSIIKVFSQKGVEMQHSQYLPYYAGNLEVIYAYLIKADGTQIRAQRSGYSLSFPGLDVGDYIEVKYAANYFEPGTLNGEFWSSYGLNTNVPVFKNRFSLLYHNKKELAIAEHNPDGVEFETHEQKIESMYNLLQYTATDVPAKKVEVLQPDGKDAFSWIDISTIKEWDRIKEWYSDLYLGQCELTRDVAEKAFELTSDKLSVMEKIKAIYNYVAREIEYEDLTFQYSGHIPQKAESVMSDGFGDCKDKSTLLITMLKAIDVPAYIALSEPEYTGKNFFLPSPRFSHAITVIEVEGETMIIDPTSGIDTFKDTSPFIEGTYYLPITPEGTEFPGLLVVDKKSDPKTTTIITHMSQEGENTSVSGDILYAGNQAAMMRTLMHTVNEDLQRLIFTQILNSSVPGLELTDLVLEDFEDLSISPGVKFASTIPRAFRKLVPGMYSVSLPWLVSLEGVLTSAVGNAGRDQDMLVDEPYYTAPQKQYIVYEIPAGYTLAARPEDQTFEYKDAVATFTYKQQGNTILCTRELYIPKMYVNPLEYEGLRTFILDTIDKEQEPLVLKK